MSKQRTPDGPPPPPVVQRLRLRYAKRGRLRFTSHRDFARAFERALRRARVPMGYSAGFSPHPKISWVNATPTGVASEAEYVEIGLAVRCEPADIRAALDDALPPGLDVLECVEAPVGSKSLADLVDASSWEIRLPGVEPSTLERALERFVAADEVPVERRTKDGVRRFDARAPLVTASVSSDPGSAGPCAILHCVVRHVTPAVRTDDILSGLRSVDPELAPPAPPEARRLAQGHLDDAGRLADPLGVDRALSS